MTIQHIAKANVCFSLFGQKEKAVLRTGAERKKQKNAETKEMECKNVMMLHKSDSKVTSRIFIENNDNKQYITC